MREDKIEIIETEMKLIRENIEVKTLSKKNNGMIIKKNPKQKSKKELRDHLLSLSNQEDSLIQRKRLI